MRRIAMGTAVAAVLVAAVAGGCAAPTSGNPNSGYTNDVANLLVKIPALRGDPCRGADAGQMFADCGRFVTEVANVLAALHASLPGEGQEIDGVQTMVNTYQRLACDSAGSAPSAAQTVKCPDALRTIGAGLDRLGAALTAIPTSR
jgi:hypothetical protein